MKSRLFGKCCVALVITLAILASSPVIGSIPSATAITHTASSTQPAAWTGVERWFGSDRYATAVEISKKAFPGGTDTVIIATGANWPDALCAAPLCSVNDASLLLVRPDSVPTVVLNEISRLGATEAIILGGVGAVSSGVADTLASRVDSIRRISGGNRYETAAWIAAEVMLAPGWDGSAFYATGTNFPDALGASAIAASHRMPILLSTPQYLPNSTALIDGDVTSGIIVGGTSVVGGDVESALRQRMSVTRLQGSNRYETTKAIMDHAVANWGTDVSRVGIASGANFPDALAAGVALGKSGQGQLLTAPNSLASPSAVFLNGKRGQTDSVLIFGGTGAVSGAITTEIEALMWAAEFSGTGSTGVGPFTLSEGLSVFDMTHTGSSNYIVWLLDSGGKEVGLLANVIGNYDGSQATGVDSQGSYYLDVDADGPWSIDITQPRPSVSSLPYTTSFSGSGPLATALFRTGAGAHTFSFSHSGSSNFVVWLLDMNGDYVDLLANEIGSTSGSTISGLEAGGYLLNVDADGPWTVTIN